MEDLIYCLIYSFLGGIVFLISHLAYKEYIFSKSNNVSDLEEGDEAFDIYRKLVSHP